MRVIKVPADDAVEPTVEDIDGGLKAMQQMIGGGYIEIVRTPVQLDTYTRLVFVVDEDGISKQLPPNYRMGYSRYYPGPIFGDVFLVGEGRHPDGEIDFLGLPKTFTVNSLDFGE